MIIEEPIICIRQYDGELYFSVETEDDLTYTVITYPKTLQYRIIYPDGRQYEDDMKGLGHTYFMLEAEEPGLARFVYRCLSWYIDPRERKEEVWKKKSVTLEGTTYTIEFCEEKGEVILHQPAKTIICYRNSVSDYRELSVYHHTGLMPHIARAMYDIAGAMPKDSEGSDVKMPMVFNDLQRITIGGSTYVIGYDVGIDLLCVQIPPKVDKLHSWLLPTQLPELTVLHNGKLLDEMESFIQLHQEKDWDLNRNDVF